MMTKISRFPVSGRTWSRFRDDFYSAVTSLEDKKEIRDFLSQVLTRTEEVMLAKRLQIAILLLLGYEYDEIENKMKVANNTIAKVNNLINKDGEVFRKIAERIIDLKQRKLDSIKKKRSQRARAVGEGLGKAAAKAAADSLGKRIAKRKKKKSISS